MVSGKGLQSIYQKILYLRSLKFGLINIKALTCAIESNCSTHLHDPRRVAQFMDEGLKLAKHRAKVLTQIIRGDPQVALNLALDEKGPISSLPEPFTEYTEKWVNEFADVEAIHSCYDLNHPKGLIKRWATFDNGERVRAWVYGHRSRLATARGVAVWGIQLGEDIAISDRPYRIVKDKAGNEMSVRIGSQEISFANDFEKNLLVQDLKLAEASNLSGRRAFSYPMIAGSLGNTDYYERKYTLVETLATWTKQIQRLEIWVVA
jgi:hypothetical protein